METHAQLMEIKRWADRGLYGAIRENLDGLSEPDSGLMLLVLDHIHTVDRIFQHHLLGRPHGYTAARSQTLPAFEALAGSSWELGDWYADYAEALSDDDLREPIDFVFTSGKSARMTRGEILLHVSLHGTYHRGNAGALLQLRGLKPSPDSITDYLEAAA